MSVQFVAAKWFRVLALIALGGIGFVAAAFFQAISSDSWGQWKALLNVAVLFAVLGALYGTIAALDSKSDFAGVNHPRIRTAFCAFFGAAAVFVVWSWFPANFSAAWLVAGAAVGAVLGWYGWRWAKYVDF
jgi:hypothetical protein